jgi:hypothetical protein
MILEEERESAQAAVEEPGGGGGYRRRQIGHRRKDQAKPAARGVPGDAASVDAAADDEQIGNRYVCRVIHAIPPQSAYRHLYGEGASTPQAD